ncbi:cytochrome P450 [Lentzea flava]|uniref:Cytochrome P450 n=1 Tax=Lentzea flava TaxID=103732 RepID=A0ABQ2V3D4_9PSEU|nr:cytochrome P450 [Lentzea flava]MCP2203204.1 Cytochrome P450 [Lentzea flava]GGU66417.1 cytochrome P450 [Lentzea flava]
MPVPVAPRRWPLLGHTPAMLIRRAEFTDALHEHGDVVRLDLGPLHAYFVTSPALTHEVLVSQGSKFRKGAMFDKFQPYLGTGLLLSNGEFHLRQRRLMQPAFHRERIETYASTMARAAASLAARWQPGEIRVIENDMQELAVTIVGEALFSTEMGHRAVEEVRRSIFTVIQQGMIRALSPSFVEKLPIPGNREFDAAIARMKAVVLQVIESWRADGTDHGDVLSMLLLAGMTDQQTYDEVLTLLTAGIETTAIALAWALYEVGRNPEIEHRLHAEVDAVLGGRPVTFADVASLTYTEQVVQETLRRYPIWFVMRRTLTDVQLGDVHLPAGAEVIVSPHALHHDERYFPEPRRFDPGRWTPEFAASLPRGAFIPFGGGNRQCLGNTFAHTEIVITLATIATRWRLVPTRPARVKFTSAPYPHGLLMKAVPRN